ncbi:hypothetical protein MLD38_000059 [Melastoma candidum]|uniref:Uncharacterized protein n=1 Tax=Melastoma candidum TaxID=119954 RepID=A0ACB9SAV0_9MYRT|nr:hypothetical protein MLD38_000059 [Melastoma candidum]
MSDHLVLFVNRLVTDSTLRDDNLRGMHELPPLASRDFAAEFVLPSEKDMAMVSPPAKLVQCRICHEEDEDSNLEVPCSCKGSLKYAHRNCVQRWCNEKGDTDCEICLQFRPNYTASLTSSGCNDTPPSFRGITWDVSGRDLLDYTGSPEFGDEDFSYPKGLVCCRIVAIIFLVLLVLRCTLPIVLSGVGKHSLTFTVLFLRTVGFLLPMYIMAKVFTIIRQRQRESVLQTSVNLAEEENELPEWQPSSRSIQIG